MVDRDRQVAPVPGVSTVSIVSLYCLMSHPGETVLRQKTVHLAPIRFGSPRLVFAMEAPESPILKRFQY